MGVCGDLIDVSPVVIRKLLRATKVADLEGRFPVRVKDTLCIDENVIRFDIPMSNALAMEESQSVEKLIHHLLDHLSTLIVQHRDVFFRRNGYLVTTGGVVAAQAAWHVVAD